MFSADDGALGGCDVVYVAVDVPTDDRGQSDLAPIKAMVERVRRKLAADGVLVILSQVPPGYTRALPVPPAQLYYQVETLVFGRAVERATKPERFIVGCADPRRPLPAALRTFLESFSCPILPMAYESAELAKISINFCLVASITVANTLAEICERDRRQLVGHRAGAEARPAHRPGRLSQPRPRHCRRQSRARPADGGADRRGEKDRCRRGESVARQLGASQGLAVAGAAGPQFEGQARAKIAVLGLAYKENTHSTKNSPSLALLAHLRGMQVKVHDPVVPASVAPWTTGAADPLAAAEDADVLIIATPWPQYRELKPGDLARVMKGRAVLDPYRVLDGDACAAAGLTYHTLGMPPLAPAA